MKSTDKRKKSRSPASKNTPTNSPTDLVEPRRSGVSIPLQNISTYAERAEKTILNSQDLLDKEVESLIDDQYGGYENLFLIGQVKSTPSEWAEMIYSDLESQIDRNSGLDCSSVKQAIDKIKDKHRESEFLRLASNHVYLEENVYVRTAQDLKALLRVHKIFIEENGKDMAILEAIHVTKGKFAQTKIEVESGCLELSDDENIVVIIDSHQNKHHNPQLPQLEQYSGGRGSQFSREKDLDWHRCVTMPVVRESMNEAIQNRHVTENGEVYCPSKRPKHGITYDLSIRYDNNTGKYVGTYHCNPQQTENG